MTTYTLAGAFGWAGGGKSGAIVDIWATSRFSGIPAENQAPPSGNPDAGPVETGPTFGSPGAYEITGITVLQDYYVRIQYGGQTYWGTRTGASLGGVGGGGDVLTVFGRTGNVVGQSGDYTAAQVGADVTGAAAIAQSNAETFATTAANTAQSNAEGFATTAASTAQSNAETFATTAAGNAETAAKAASLALTGGTMSGAITMGSHPITGITDLAVVGLTGATQASRYVGQTTSGAPVSGTFLTGDFVTDQTGRMYTCTAGGSPGTWVSGTGAATLLGGGVIAGTYTAGQPLLYQGGPAGSTATAANFSFSFPSSFPNSLISLLIQPTELGNSNVVMIDTTGSGLSIGAGQYFRNGSPLTGAMTFTYWAIGS